MSAPKRPSDDQDPDYLSPGPTNAKQQKIYEQTARANTANKIIAIVEKEFSKEIDDKEKEVLEIQNRLHKALKTLHLLRYVVITDFYNRKQCQAPQAAETKQTQIHPAIKRLIGKTPRRQKSVGLQDPGPSTSRNLEGILQSEIKDEVVIKSEITSEIEKRLGQISENPNDSREINQAGDKVSSESLNDDPPKKIPRYIPPRSNVPVVTSPARGVRHKVRKRIVVGNISKWIPPDWREDGASHKWMMYVRGSKDAPDITDFVSKVRFFLHPSYQPNDVVQVVSPPFHLSRRGWGEFPLRVQLHFKNVLNKPMDIIHYLKLDRTYTGLQTLGSETVVDIWIHTTTPHNFKKNLDPEFGSEDSSGKTKDEIQPDNNEIDLSIIKKECPQGSESLVNESNILQSSVKVEPMESNASTDDNFHLITGNCIKIEHNYVSNTYKEEESVQVVHSMENNVTIKHSPAVRNQEFDDTMPVDDDSPPSQDENSTIATSSENVINLRDEDMCDSEIQERNLSSSESQTATIFDKNEPSNGRYELKTNICEPGDTNQANEGVKSSGKNVENGEAASPVPIKLVKCNDKFYFMTDIGKLPSNQVDFVKIANSDIVRNILAKRIQPTKVSVLGSADSGLKRIISVKNAVIDNPETLELSNGRNGLEKDASEYSIAQLELGTNSIDKNLAEREYFEQNKDSKLPSPQKFSKDNYQQLEMQKLASSLKSIPSKSEPLKITIPAPFEPTRKKQILVFKNNKLISVNAALNSRQLPRRSILYDKNQEMNTDNFLSTKNRVSLLTKGEGTSLLKQSVSILKKPILNNLVKLEQSNKPATILKINPSNSLLLNSNSAIPALQIATPLQNSQNERRNMIIQNRIGQMKLKRLPKNVKIDIPEDSKPLKVSVTLGKDRQKILSKRDAYEDILRSIETVQINDTIGTLRYIMKRIPLITEEARDSDYRQMHPYACCTQEEFFNYHVGKQRAHEWYRAKMVRSLLRKKNCVDDQLWSVKEILNWARIHGYTPVQSSLAIGNAGKTSNKLPDKNSVPISTCTESLPFNEWLENCKDVNNSNEESDIEVDVVHIAEPKIKTEIKTEIIEAPKDMITLEIEPSQQLPCAFVNETAREIGVRLQKEEIIPGVRDSTAERMIAQAMQCLVDDLVRRSLAKAWERNSNKCPDTIIPDDVRGALLSREEFDIFTNEGLGSLQNMG